MPAVKTGNRRRELELAASPLAPQPDWLYGSLPWLCEIAPHG
jgi:hypothetical protein